jgi:hypothetical protein
VYFCLVRLQHVLLTAYPDLFALRTAEKAKKHPNKQQLANITVGIYEGCHSNFVKLKIPAFQVYSNKMTFGL